jgi:SAM-dependent methyltransferase
VVPPHQPLALDAYEALAEAYAAHIDTKPHNAWYERPATLSLLPDVAGLTVLDAGCGPGAYAEWLLDRGANVTSIDASPKMIELARARTRNRATFFCADLASDLPFLPDASFDLILAPLVMDYIADWPSVFRRFHRALKPGGHFVFSVGHPAFDAVYYKTQNYFAVEAVSALWKGFGPHVVVPTHRRPLAEILNPLLHSGFQLLQVLEPLPTPEFRLADPVKHQRLLNEPAFLCLKAQRP